MKVHHEITEARVCAAVEESTFGMANTGLCLACGSEQEGCEPDARRYRCDACGRRAVFGAPEVLLMGAYHTPRVEG